MKKRNQDRYGLLLSLYFREAGSAVIEGKKVSWDGGTFLRIIPAGDEYGNVKKLPVHEDYIKTISEATANMDWGQYVKVVLQNGKVVELTPELLSDEIQL